MIVDNSFLWMKFVEFKKRRDEMGDAFPMEFLVFCEGARIGAEAAIKEILEQQSLIAQLRSKPHGG